MKSLRILLILISLTIAGSGTQAQSVFETHVGWGSPGGAVLNFGMAWFRVQNDSVEFQAVLQDSVGQTASLQPVFILSGSELPFSLGAGQHFAASGFRYQNPFVPASPFDPNAPVTDNYFQGTSFRGSFQAFAGLESQLLSEAATLRVTYDNGSISGPLTFVSVPEPAVSVILALGVLAATIQHRRKSLS